ncbi:MAG: hypothetical protein Q4D79_08320 [Propionibacteriaceae bacterium]|nr:hypothetical protein [Propionibacteriaceae bacterium]
MNFAQKVKNGDFDMNAVAQMSDEEAIETLSSLSGIGKWTAEMVLLFSLQRPDILSYGDLAIRRGIQIVYQQKRIREASETSVTLLQRGKLVLLGSGGRSSTRVGKFPMKAKGALKWQNRNKNSPRPPAVSLTKPQLARGRRTSSMSLRRITFQNFAV